MDPSTNPNYHFVNMQHPDDMKDDRMQLRIRRLAMTEVAKGRRKPKTKRERNEIVLEFREPMDNRINFERVGCGNIDPFCSYPIQLDDSTRALVANGECVFPL
jgi:ribonuclease PH